jgi:hypothetical protein
MSKSKITVRTAAGKTLDLDLDFDNTVTLSEVRNLIEKKWPDDYPVQRQRLIINGNPVSCFDSCSVEEAGIKPGCVLHLLKRAGSAQSQPNKTEERFQSVAPPANTNTGGLQQVRVCVPANAAPGQTLRITFNNKQYDVKIPTNCAPGSQFAVNLPV